jgi:hypothetical protein
VPCDRMWAVESGEWVTKPCVVVNEGGEKEW